MKNPLVAYHQLPPFKSIRLQHIGPALDEVLADNRAQLEKILAQRRAYTWKNLMLPLEEMDDRLHRMWYPIKHWHSVMDSPELREIYVDCIRKLSQYETALSQNEALYKAILSLSRGQSFKRLGKTQKKIIDDKLRDFKLSGVVLSQEKKKRFMALSIRHDALTIQFGENVLDATHAWTFLVKDEKRLSGLPDYIKALLERKAKEKGMAGFLLTLDFPIYHAVMTYADDAALREKMYEAYVTRASDQGPNAGCYDNTKVMEELLEVRQALAKLVGFKNYAAYSLETKMAKKPKIVLTFMNDLIRQVKSVSRQEFQALQTFARNTFHVQALQVWDVGYFSEKLRRRLFTISDEELRPFFPESRVLSGLFSLISRLYGLKIQEVKKADVWHKDVRFFKVYDVKNQLRGYFYTDLYAREHKRGGAWANDYCARRKRSDKRIQLPVAYLCCNFSPKTSRQPSLLTHDEVLTLFHEMGHCLHHLLSKVDYIDVSGWNGVEWDAVELPSQFMENFAWEASVIESISGHYRTGKPLPKEMIDNLLRTKTFQAGLQLVRQLQFSLFDFQLHQAYKKGFKIQGLQDEIRKELSVIPVPKFNRFQNSFTHIFSGSYAAGYYSYLWSEVLSCDAFSRFEVRDSSEQGNPQHT